MNLDDEPCSLSLSAHSHPIYSSLSPHLFILQTHIIHPQAAVVNLDDEPYGRELLKLMRGRGVRCVTYSADRDNEDADVVLWEISNETIWEREVRGEGQGAGEGLTVLGVVRFPTLWEHEMENCACGALVALPRVMPDTKQPLPSSSHPCAAKREGPFVG